MARVVIIGGSGHVGTYLVPALVQQDHDVATVTRGRATPYREHEAWARVEQVAMDRTGAEKAGTFGSSIAAFHPDVVVDMISFDLASTRQLVDALRDKVEHFLHCGTIWVHGRNAGVPSVETDPLDAFGEYGTNKAAIETWLLQEARAGRFPATVFRPGHIVGPGWAPINPLGNLNTDVFTRIARGEEIALPNFGLETLHHVHAEDVAQVVLLTIANKAASVGEAFNAASPRALTLRGYADAMFRWFGREPRLRFEPFDEWKHGVSADDARITWDHIVRSSWASIEKAQRLLGYEPRYTSLAAIQESVAALIAAGQVPSPSGWMA